MKFKIKPQKQIASIIPKQGIINVSNQFFNIKNYNIRVFILLHELCHNYTSNEIEADTIAFKLYSERGYPIRDCIYAITKYIPNYYGIQRARNLYECAKFYFKNI